MLIAHDPLRTRQPDLLFISHAQLAECGDEQDPAPLYVAPEIVVEILSPSETRRIREEEIRDYCAVGVRECWVVSPEDETVEILRLTAAGAETAAIYTRDQQAQSALWPDLVCPVAEIFAA